MEKDVWQHGAACLLLLLVVLTSALVQGVINSEKRTTRINDPKCKGHWWLYWDIPNSACYPCSFAVEGGRNEKKAMCKDSRLGEAVYKDVDYPLPGEKYQSVSKCDIQPLQPEEVLANCSADVLKYTGIQNKTARPGAECFLYCIEGYAPVLKPGVRIECASCTNKSEFCQWDVALPDVLCTPINATKYNSSLLPLLPNTMAGQTVWGPPVSTTPAPRSVGLYVGVGILILVFLAAAFLVTACCVYQHRRQQHIQKIDGNMDISSTTSMASASSAGKEEECSPHQSLLTIAGVDRPPSEISIDENPQPMLTSLTSTGSGDTTHTSDTGYGSDSKAVIDLHVHNVHNHTHNWNIVNNQCHTTTVNAQTVEQVSVTQNSSPVGSGSGGSATVMRGIELCELQGTTDDDPEGEGSSSIPPRSPPVEGVTSDTFNTRSDDDGGRKVSMPSDSRGDGISSDHRGDSIPFCDHGLVADDSSPSTDDSEGQVPDTENTEHLLPAAITNGVPKDQPSLPSVTDIKGGYTSSIEFGIKSAMSDVMSDIPKGKRVMSAGQASINRSADSGIGTANSENLRSHVERVEQHVVVPQTAPHENLEGLVTIDDTLRLPGIALESESCTSSSQGTSGTPPQTIRWNTRAVPRGEVAECESEGEGEDCEAVQSPENCFDSLFRLPIPVPITSSQIYSEDIDFDLGGELGLQSGDMEQQRGIRERPVGSSDHLNCITVDCPSDCDPLFGKALSPLNARSGNVLSGNAMSGNAPSGNVLSGNASFENAPSVNSLYGDVLPENTLSDNSDTHSNTGRATAPQTLREDSAPSQYLYSNFGDADYDCKNVLDAAAEVPPEHIRPLTLTGVSSEVAYCRMDNIETKQPISDSFDPALNGANLVGPSNREAVGPLTLNPGTGSSVNVNEQSFDVYAGPGQFATGMQNAHPKHQPPDLSVHNNPMESSNAFFADTSQQRFKHQPSYPHYPPHPMQYPHHQQYAPPQYMPQQYPPQQYSPQQYSPQQYPSQQCPPQQYPPQQYPPQQYPPQQYPPQQYPPQQYPAQQYPPEQYSPQQYSPQQCPPRQCPPRQYPPEQYPPQQCPPQQCPPQPYPSQQYPPQQCPPQQYPAQQCPPQQYPAQQDPTQQSQRPQQSPQSQHSQPQSVYHNPAHGVGLVVHATTVGDIFQEHKRTTCAPSGHVQDVTRQNSQSQPGNVFVEADNVRNIYSITTDKVRVT